MFYVLYLLPNQHDQPELGAIQWQPVQQCAQCLQVKKDTSKIGCIATVGKDSELTKLPHGRYPNAFNDYERGKRQLSLSMAKRIATLTTISLFDSAELFDPEFRTEGLVTG